MPYGGTAPEQDKLIERCVTRVMPTLKNIKDPKKRKSRAIAICKSSVMKKKNTICYEKDNMETFPSYLKNAMEVERKSYEPHNFYLQYHTDNIEHMDLRLETSAGNLLGFALSMEGEVIVIKGPHGKEWAEKLSCISKGKYSVLGVTDNQIIFLFDTKESHAKSPLKGRYSVEFNDGIAYLRKLPDDGIISLSGRIEEQLSSEFKMPYKFPFIALREGKFNGVFYPEKVLARTYKTMEGKPLTKNHGKDIEDVIGKVEKVYFEDGAIKGIAVVNDEAIARKIHEGLLKGVSIEAYVDHEEGKQGDIASDIEFIGLSVVRIPACKTPKCGIDV